MPPAWSGTGLLEREAELAAIDERLRSAREGDGGVLLIEGPAGIGKTGLLAFARRRAATLGLQTLSARAGDTEMAFPWGVVRQLFESGLLRAPAQERNRLLADAAALAIPALGVAPLSSEKAPSSEFAALHGLYWLTVNIVQRGALLLAVDDLQWCDLPSLRFLSYLGARLEGMALLVVAAVRRGDSTGRLVSRLALEPVTRVLHLKPLSSRATRALIRAHMDEERPAASFCEVCQEITGGNPFLLGALLSDLASKRVGTDAAAVERVRRMTPEVISQSVLLRLGALPSSAETLARAIALLGAGATPSRVAALAETPLNEAIDALRALTDAEIICGEEVLSFVHPIVWAAVHGDISTLERGRLHERAARLLVQEGARAAEVTAHLLAAAANANGWIIERLREAATDARRRGASETAVACLRRALQEPPGQGQRAEILSELGQAEALIDPGKSCEHLAEALQLARDPTQRASISLALGRTQAFSGAFGSGVDTLDQALQELTKGAASQRSSLQAELLNAAHWDLATRPRTSALLGNLERDHAAGVDLDPRLHAHLAIAAVERGVSREAAITHARRALHGDGTSPGDTATMRHAITVLAVCDELAEAERCASRWLTNAQQRGLVLPAALAASVCALVALLGGRISDGLAYARQSLTPSAEVWTPPFGIGWLVEALTERGELDEAVAELGERGLEQELPRTWPFALLRFCRGRLRAARGEHQHALADLLAAGELTEALGIVNPALMPWRSSAALTLGALSRDDEALALGSEELALARDWGAPRPLGIALRALGLVTPGPQGLDELREAVGVLQRSCSTLEHARALTDLGAALRRAGQRVEARELLRRGLDLAHRFGGKALADRARRELQVAGARPRRDALRGRDALTPSELRVARMAAEGQSNRQIAQALFVTLRTVELHLTNSYSKLGIRRREQLADALDKHAND